MYPSYEVLVVDGSPNSETADLVRSRFSAVRYLRLPRGGLAVARNRGLLDARGEIVAYTDDDVVVDPQWLSEHVGRLITDAKLACSTGLPFPLELATPAQLWFEESGGYVAGFEPRLLELATRDRRSLLPWATGKIGAGVNMAWRTSVLREIGGNDVTLDRTAGEDLALFFDALCAGYRIAYEPRAIVFHEHRRSYQELRHQIYFHAVGITAHLTRCLVKYPERIPDFVSRVPRGIAYGFRSSSIRNNRKSPDFPSELTWAECPGILVGPFAYLRGRREAKQLSAFPPRG